jgi:hypothetical protein
MKVLLDIQDHKAAFVLELLKNFSFVKAKAITEEKALIISELREAVQHLEDVRSGKKEARPARDLLNEL